MYVLTFSDSSCGGGGGALTLLSSPKSYKKAVDLRSVAPQQKDTGCCADVVNSATQPHNTRQAEESNEGSADDGFILVTRNPRNEIVVSTVANQILESSRIENTSVWCYKHYYPSCHRQEIETCINLHHHSNLMEYLRISKNC
jgi:hypothetical protein